MNPSHQRVIQALSHRAPDSIPLFDSFWGEFVEIWRQVKGLKEGDPESYYGIDVRIAAGDETPWPSRAEILEEGEDHRVERDGWGAVKRTRKGGYFYEEISQALENKACLDSLSFESPELETRYAGLDRTVRKWKKTASVFCKTGGPFLRSVFLRGKERFLMDLAEDRCFAKALVDRVTDHIAEVGTTALKRWRLEENGVWMYDDMAFNAGPFMSPSCYEEVFLPALTRLCQTFKTAGSRFVVLHSDGNIERLIPSLIAAGIDAIHPVEPKAGMDLPGLFERYGDRLGFVGGMCNTHTLPSGDKDRIRKELKRLISVAKGGGVILGCHSIGPDVSVETYEYYLRAAMELWEGDEAGEAGERHA